MRKLINGIVEFRQAVRPGYRETFAQLALGQQPDALFFSCSDSRVAANLFASTDPGDLFVVRSVGNLIPPCDPTGRSVADESEASAIEYGVNVLGVRSAIVCGHSSCGAMKGLIDGLDDPRMPNLTRWLRHGDPAMESLERGEAPDKKLAPVDQLSQLNVLTQMDHIATYPSVREAMTDRHFGIYGLWFDIPQAEVSIYSPDRGRFVVLDEAEGKRILDELERDGVV